MALRVWLPLNGDLHNLGLSKSTISSTDSSSNNSGKIGKCMKIINTTDLLYTPNFNTKGLSFGGWFKFNKSEINPSITGATYSSNATTPTGNLLGNTNYGGIGLIWTGNNYYSSNSFNSILIFATLRTNTVNSSTAGFTVDFDVWMHIFLSWDPVTHILSLYKNGILYNSKVFSNFTDGVSKNLYLNYKAIYGGNGPSLNIPFYCNDVRIYDHALSDKEIKELSKGLILHYPLNNNGLGFNWLKNSYIERTITRASGNTFIDYEYYSDLITCIDTIYTVRFKAKGSVTGMKLDIYFRDSSGASYAITSTLTLTTSWNTYILTINGSPENILKFRVRCYGGTAGDIIYIKNLRLFSDNMPLRENIIYDSSGYNHNGIITGAITIENGNQKYNKNIHMSATSQYIKISGLNTTGFSNSYSFAWWGKIDTYSGKMFWGFSDGVRLNGIYNGNLWNTGDSASNPLYNPGTTTQVTAPSGNTWEYWVMTGNGTKCYVYRNGVLWGEAKTYKTITGTTIYINGWDTGVNYKSTNMSISDFRIYATALSADDVLELYKLSKIINNGNILPRSLD